MTIDDLITKLGESLVWIDLRVKLMTILQKQVDEGDQRARDQMEFLSRRWPGGGAPRQGEFARLQTALTTALDNWQAYDDECYPCDSPPNPYIEEYRKLTQ